MIYLASPYSDPDPAVREQRFQAACRATAALMRAGNPVYSPIVHGHPLVEHGLPTDWPFWERYTRPFLDRCNEVVVLTLEGWEESVGVQGEIQIAIELAKPVRYLAPGDGLRVTHVGPRRDEEPQLERYANHPRMHPQTRA